MQSQDFVPRREVYLGPTYISTDWQRKISTNRPQEEEKNCDSPAKLWVEKVWAVLEMLLNLLKKACESLKDAVTNSLGIPKTPTCSYIWPFEAPSNWKSMHMLSFTFRLVFLPSFTDWQDVKGNMATRWYSHQQATFGNSWHWQDILTSRQRQQVQPGGSFPEPSPRPPSSFSRTLELTLYPLLNIGIWCLYFLLNISQFILQLQKPLALPSPGMLSGM